MDNLPITVEPPHPLDPLLKAGTSLQNKMVISLKSLPTNTPLGRLLADYVVLGKTIQDIALMGTSKEPLITNYHCYMPTLINHQLALRNIQACSGWALQANIYHGSTHHSLSKANILQCDIFIASYNTITQEFNKKRPLNHSFLNQLALYNFG
ncbi:hypothetical protein O181_011224 [Austropuccinia psidii MF-1]|uniref:Uncharacterized protein n=1 Tax=Austropuccinia psidii MF-1 TaxID=1389203 RepID=A0A9Q3BSH0_9BASI|nr:hypothetical protein [Austropuccinia psidii MF-1]